MFRLDTHVVVYAAKCYTEALVFFLFEKFFPGLARRKEHGVQALLIEAMEVDRYLLRFKIVLFSI